jgi:transposase
MSQGRPIEVEWKHGEEELRRLYNQEKHVERRTRYQALWLIRGGRTMREVSEIVDRHYDTICRWMDWYRESGLSEVTNRLPGQAGGVESYLTPDQETQLVKRANEGVFHTAREIQHWLNEEFGVDSTHKGVYSLLERLEIVWKVPRPTNPKADPTQQESWKKGGYKTS